MTEAGSRKRLAGRVAVVTGAGNGIGRAEALLLASEGARVVVNDLGCDVYGEGADPRVAQAVADEIREAGGEAVANPDTVTTMEGGRRIIATALEAFGRLDILINNAGFTHPHPIWEMTEEEWDSVIAVHLKGTFTTTRAAAPIFREQQSGIIVNTASESGLGHWGMANYSAAKEGIVGFTRTIARDLGRYNVRCNAIRPRAGTRIATPQVIETLRISESLGIPGLGYRRQSPTGAKSSAEESAVLAVWLCTDAAASVSGRAFQIGRGEVGLWTDPDLVRSSFRPDGWTLDALDAPGIRDYLLEGIPNPFMPSQK